MQKEEIKYSDKINFFQWKLNVLKFTIIDRVNKNFKETLQSWFECSLSMFLNSMTPQSLLCITKSRWCNEILSTNALKYHIELSLLYSF